MTVILVTKASTVLQATAPHPHWVSFSFLTGLSVGLSVCPQTGSDREAGLSLVGPEDREKASWKISGEGHRRLW